MKNMQKKKKKRNQEGDKDCHRAAYSLFFDFYEMDSKLFSGKNITARFDFKSPFSSKCLNPSNQADLQYLNWYSIWIASTKQVGIIWIRGAATLCQSSYRRGICYSDLFYQLKIHVGSKARCSVKSWRMSGNLLKYILGLSVCPEEILLALSGTISVS